MMNNLVRVLMDREGMSERDVINWIAGAVDEFLDSEDMRDIEEILHGEFGLEPDYLFDLMEFL